MSLLKQLLDNNQVYLYVDFRSGSLKDHSGNQTPTNDGCILINKKAYFPINTTVGYGVIGIGTGDFSILVKQKPYQYNALAIHSNTTGGYSTFNVANYSSGGLSLYMDSTYYNVSGTGAEIGKDNRMGWTCDRDGNARVFYNGLFVGLRDISAKSAYNLQINAEINYKTSTRRSDYDYVLIVKRVLTDTEMAQLTAELENKKWTSKTKSSTHPYSSIINGKLYNDDNWTLGTDGTSGNNWTIGSGKLVYTSLATTGVPVTVFCSTLNLTAGKIYYLNFDLTLLDLSCRFGIFEKAGGITIVDYNTYNNGGRVSLPFTSSGLDQIRIIASQASKSFEISNLTLTEVPEVIYKTENGIKADQKTYSTAGDKIANTDLVLTSGSFKITDGTYNGEKVKVLESVSTGNVYIPVNKLHETPSESAYGEWEFVMSALDTKYNIIKFISSNTDSSSTSGDNYNISFRQSGGNNIVQVRRTNVSLIDLGSYFTGGQFYKVKVTRTSAGLFSFYIDDVLIGTATNTTYTISNYIVLIMETGSKVVLSSEKGTFGIIKK